MFATCSGMSVCLVIHNVGIEASLQDKYLLKRAATKFANGKTMHTSIVYLNYRMNVWGSLLLKRITIISSISPFEQEGYFRAWYRLLPWYNNIVHIWLDKTWWPTIKDHCFINWLILLLNKPCKNVPEWHQFSSGCRKWIKARRYAFLIGESK